MNHQKETLSSLAKQLILAPLLQRKITVALIFVASFVLSASQGALIFLTGPTLSLLFQVQDPSSVIPMSRLVPGENALSASLEHVTLTANQLLWLLPTLIVLVALCRGISLYVFQVYQELVALSVTTHVRNRLFAALLQCSYREVASRSPAEWMSIIMNDIGFLQGRLADLMRTFIRDLLLVLGGLAAILIIDWKTSLVLLAILVPIGYLMARVTQFIAKLTNESQVVLSHITAGVLDARRRYGVIRAHHAQAVESQRFLGLVQHYFRLMCRIFPLRLGFAPLTELLGVLAIGIFLSTYQDRITPGATTSDFPIQFMAALAFTIKPLKSVSEQIARLNETRGALTRTLEIFLRLQSVPADPEKETPIQGPLAATVTIDECEVYLGNKPIVKITNVDVVPGRSVAIIGPSGSGKSTFLRCLAGLLPPTNWKASLPWDTIRRHTALVSQRPFLFDATLRDNLIYGHPCPQNLDDKALWTSLKNAEIETTMSLGGLDQPIRSVRSNLSGGQVQRLVLARSLLRKQGIHVLDEITSALDPQNEAQILETLLNLAKASQQALLVVTHRLQHLNRFDEVWFFENGQLALRGPHSKLLEVPRYKSFVQQS